MARRLLMLQMAGSGHIFFVKILKILQNRLTAVSHL
jgi:hypothetical protein